MNPSDGFGRSSMVLPSVAHFKQWGHVAMANLASIFADALVELASEPSWSLACKLREASEANWLELHKIRHFNSCTICTSVA